MADEYIKRTLVKAEFAGVHPTALIYALIDRVPAADVVPVVRCKECQNSYEWANVGGDNYRYCGYLRDRWNRDYDRMVDDDDFCKWGRKMDKEDTDGETVD